MVIKTVNVLGQKYKVKTEKGGGDVFGYCDRLEGLIWLNATLTTEHQTRTLLHEVGHAAMYRSALAFSGMVSPEVEELIVEVMATASYETVAQIVKKLSKLPDEEFKREILNLFTV